MVIQQNMRDRGPGILFGADTMYFHKESGWGKS